jgi:hypothetical protein
MLLQFYFGGLFDDAVSINGYAASNGGMMDELQTIWNWQCPNLSTILAHA